MSQACDRRTLELETLRRYGTKWAVLTAMAGEMIRKGIAVPRETIEGLRSAKGKIGSGCYSACDIGCELAQAEAELFSRCDALDHDHFQQWCDLLADAMQGKLGLAHFRGIPALEPVRDEIQSMCCS